jgi:aminoglycoside phosphotransferase (APT) family kinase protein
MGSSYGPLLDCLGRYLSAAHAGIPGPVHWLHGDYHPGNLLFVGGRVSGIVDFDDVGQGARVLELACALFAFSRNNSLEDRFEFDGVLWDRGLDAYATEASCIGLEWLLQARDTLVPLFCADQVLIHLEAAQRGLWALTPGIGFLGCWNQLTSQLLANASVDTSAR